MKLYDYCVKLAGKVWRSYNSVALWPWPAILIFNHRSKLTFVDYRHFSHHLKPGDILLSRIDSYPLSNWAIGGTWFKHAAVFIGPEIGEQDEETHFIVKFHAETDQKHNIYSFKKLVVEAIGEGVICRDFGEFFQHADHIIALRPWHTKEQQNKIVNAAKRVIGLPYNTAFDFKSHKSLYCTELAAYCLEQAGIDPPKMSRIPKHVVGLFIPIKHFTMYAWLADSFLHLHNCHRVAISKVTSKHLNTD